MKTKFALTILLSLIFSNLALYSQVQLIIPGDFESFSATSNPLSTTFKTFTLKDAAGTKYLFKDWVKGSVTNKAGKTFEDGAFNFDKVNQALYLKLKDPSSIFVVNKDQLVTIALTDGNTSYLLKKIPSLDTSNFYNELVNGKYSLYSLIKTEFIPANYQTNGIVSSGNLYDEYKDHITYYVVFPDGSAQEVLLKKKAIKSLFDHQGAKTDNFFRNNDQLEVDENFLTLLIEYLDNN